MYTTIAPGGIEFLQLCEEVTHLAGHEIKNKLTALSLHHTMIYHSIQTGELQVDKDVISHFEKHHRSISEVTKLLDQIISKMDRRT